MLLDYQVLPDYQGLLDYHVLLDYQDAVYMSPGWFSTRVSTPQVVTFLFCSHRPGLKAIQGNPGQQFSTRADTHNMLEYCPGHTNLCLHEEISTIFTPSHLANPGLEKGAPGWQGVKGLTRLSCKR